MKTIICTCVNPWMDKKLGKGKRVANITSTGATRCTVCGLTGAAPAKRK